ncbi:lysylphosphatidylglycerol synthase domain-containing protein [Sandaracinobacter sp. RS1-74]|uniref:lysylphosphatidylglycerol synthase domain-containing protein n=1 Tax=Sandaracinobacteroides sayramensis TaxID=2913411 RepID=UPI001EDB20BA|nr:lysylphosphatidylglycerol synthase domain-containing protein [Sandaracinobacteroides sayramensis]MCG2840247.1 lysylphosphatidylglycerol synthase domain-containing protein [Sandaracinobacteroides sayramensis]
MKLDPRLSRLIGWVRVHQTWLTLAFMAVVIGVAGFALSQILKEVKVDDIRAAFGRITPHQVLLSIGLTALSFVVLSFYDVLGLKAIGKPQPYWRALLGSFTAYNLSHNLGFAPITGGAARWRAYRGTNLDAADIARVVVIAGVTFWLGIFLLLGIFLVAFPGALRVHDATMSFGMQAGIGTAILVAIAGYLIACARQTGPLNILGWTLPVPTLKQALIQFGLAATDIAIASAALLALLPPETWHHYPDFLVAYVVAVVVALLTHAPGGIGVFEAVILVTLPEVDKPSLVSALILYRLIYYWAPLLLALIFLGLNEMRMLGKPPVQPPDRDERIASRDTL